MILLISNVFWTISRFRLDTVQRLVRHGIEVRCAAKFDGTELSLSDAGADVSDLPIDRKSLSPLHEWRLLRALWKLIGQSREELVLLYTIKPIIWGGLVCRLRRRRYVCFFTGLGSALGGRGSASRLIGRLAAASARGASRVVCLNEPDARFIASLLGKTRVPITVLPGEGIDPTAYLPAQGARPSASGTVDFLFCSRVLREKGVDTFVLAARKAAALRPDLRFRIAGWLDTGNPSGLTAQQLQDLIGTAPIEYLGKLDDPREVMSSCDAVVLPTRYAEGVPRVLLEAACMEKGLIATNVPGCTDVVLHGRTGLLVEPGDVDALTEAFMRFARLSPEVRAALGRTAREVVSSRFSVDEVWKHYVGILDELGMRIEPPKQAA